ncbi:TPA: glycosyltransferase family 2 protein [Aeromonas veronii]
MSEFPLVSICVISYNSEKTILETLNSIIEQTYNHHLIEVIISDDASTDGTQSIISSWIQETKTNYKFWRITNIFNSSNGGISKNCNSAWKEASGVWVKTIAADDILLPNCISSNIDFILSENVDVVMSKMITFWGDKTQRRCLPARELTNTERRFFDASAARQNLYLQSYDLAGAPSSFMSKSMLSNVGYAEEKYTMMEDHPLWYKCTSLGYKIYFMDLNTVMYRIGDSITRSESKLVNMEYLKQVILFDKATLGHNAKTSVSRVRKVVWTRLLYTLGKVHNKKNMITKIIYFTILLIKPGYISYKFDLIKRKYCWLKGKK